MNNSAMVNRRDEVLYPIPVNAVVAVVGVMAVLVIVAFNVSACICVSEICMLPLIIT